MSKTFFRRTMSGLEPDDDMARDALKGIAIGVVVSCEVTRPRNILHHRLYWKLCQTIADAIGVQAQSVSDVIKVRSGHTVVVKTASGLMEFPKSISFGRLTQAEFSDFFNRACMVVCAEFIPHMKATEMRKRIEQIVGLPADTTEAS